MKNPFEKNDHKVLIAGIIIGTAVAGAVAYVFLTETGTTLREEMTGHINRIMDAVAGKTDRCAGRGSFERLFTA